MQKFVLYWRDGKYEIVEGNTISEAFTHAGYGAGAIRALDFYGRGENIQYEWNSDTKEWDRFRLIEEDV